jgi:hypothetical protein
MYKPFFSLLICLLSISSPLFSQSVKKLQENNGFKNHKLGSRYTSLYGVKAKQEDGTEKVVVNTPETIGSIPVESIDLIYMSDTLARIVVHVETTHSEALLNACKQSFGPYTKDISDNEKTRSLQKADSSSAPIESSRDRNLTSAYLWIAPNLKLEYNYTYPKLTGDHYAVNRLQLIYSVANYDKRFQRLKNKYSSSDF